MTRISLDLHCVRGIDHYQGLEPRQAIPRAELGGATPTTIARCYCFNRIGMQVLAPGLSHSYVGTSTCWSAISAALRSGRSWPCNTQGHLQLPNPRRDDDDDFASIRPSRSRAGPSGAASGPLLRLRPARTRPWGSPGCAPCGEPIHPNLLPRDPGHATLRRGRGRRRRSRMRRKRRKRNGQSGRPSSSHAAPAPALRPPAYLSHALYPFCFCRVFQPSLARMLLAQSSLRLPSPWTDAKG